MPSPQADCSVRPRGRSDSHGGAAAGNAIIITVAAGRRPISTVFRNFQPKLIRLGRLRPASVNGPQAGRSCGTAGAVDGELASADLARQAM
jgi:hypothetical protein